MRILVASPFLPNPAATHGGAVYLGALLSALARVSEVGLVSFVRPSELRWQDRPSSGVSFSRGIELSGNFDMRRAQRIVHKARMVMRWGFRGLPLLPAKFCSRAMRDALHAARREFRPDAILVEFALMAQYLDALSGVPTILTDHEHGTTPDQAVFLGLGKARDERLWERYVRTCYPRASLVQALNEDDASRIAALITRPVEVRPPVVPMPEEAVAPERTRQCALFLGDYSHRPNPEAARFLAENVWPIVRRHLPKAELVLAGPRANGEVKRLAQTPGVSFLGFVPDLHSLLADTRFVLAPVFSGSGSRIKVLTALAHGVPVVSNALGLRGVKAPVLAARVAESADDLAAHAVALLEEPAEAGRAGRAAREWAKETLRPEVLAGAQLERIKRLIRDGR